MDRGEDVEDVGLTAVDRRPLARVPHPRPDEVAERHRPEPLQRVGEAGGGARHPAGGRADVERLRRLGVEADRHRDQLGAALDPVQPGGGDEEVDQRRLAALVDHHVAAGAEPGQRALDRKGSQHRADGGVDRVAARAQDPGAGLGGQRMAGCDDPLHALPPGTG